jgi:long-chain acyl-CoA synthetase
MGIKHQLKEIFSLLDKKKCEKRIFQEIKDSFTVNGKLMFAGELLHIAYKKFTNRTALIGADRTIDYKEFYFRSVQLSLKLKEQNVAPHDRVMIIYENSIEFYIAYFAAWQVGAVAVPVNIFLHERELAHIIKDCIPSVIIASDALEHSLNNLVKDKLLDDLPTVLNSKVFDWQTPVPERVENVYPDFEIETLNPDDLCLLLYTSGTTGLPKGVMLSSRNILTNAMQAYARLAIAGKRECERFFSVLPLFHSFAQNTCIWLPLMTGSDVIIVSRIDRKFILEGLHKKPTLFFGFPALYGLLCLLRNAPLDSIRLFISGADMLPDKIRSAFATIYGRKICSGYGLTEASPVVAVNIENPRKATQVVGPAVVGLECDIRNEDGKSLSVGSVGTLWIRGDNIMQGYYNAPGATAKILQNGWLNTGDLASMDKEGNLAIIGRSKDLIIHKGFNIYPPEIENILLSHPAVYKAAVIGKEESFSGEIPVAFVAVKSAEYDIEKSLRELCSNNLASYKIPKKFVCMEDLPMNATGKVDKKQLQV